MVTSLRNSTRHRSPTNLRASGVFVVGRIRRAYGHRRSTVLLGGAPVRSDVLRRVQVRVIRVFALLAHESFAARSVLPGRVPALGAPLRRVPGVHVHHCYPVLRRLVGHHVLLASERPGMDPSARVRSEAGTPKADVRQVFEHQRGATRQRVQDVLRDVVVAPEPKPLPLPDALLQPALGGTCAFGLEAALRPVIPPVYPVPVGLSDDLTVGQCCRNHDASITTDHIFGNLGGFDLLGEGEGEPPVALVVSGELAAVAAPAVVSLQPEMLVDGQLEALAHRGQGDLHPVRTEGHGVGVEGDGQRLGRGAGSLLALLDALTNGSNGSHGEPHDVAGELRLEAVLRAESVVSSVMELDGALDGRVVEGDRGGIVVGGCDTSLQVEQGRLGFRRDIDSNSDRARHHRVHVVPWYPMDVKQKGALLPSLKEGVSARFLKNGKVEAR